MAKKDKKQRHVEQTPAESIIPDSSITELSQSETSEPEAASKQPVAASAKKKYYYNPEKAKERRDKLMEFAKAGGYEPKKRVGTGVTEKRTSKSGKTYYYTPWGKLTEDQKDQRLAQARDRMKEERALARKYKEEHPDEFATKKEG